MRASGLRRVSFLLLITAVVFSMFSTAVVSASPGTPQNSSTGKLVFFVADGLRQDLAAKYAKMGLMPETAKLIQTGAIAADSGMLTQAPPNTGAGWFSLATGAWSAVTGSTNNTFAKNGAPFSTRVRFFRCGCAAS